MTTFKHTMFYAVKTASVLLTAFLLLVCAFFGYIFYCNIANMQIPTLGPYQIYVVLSDSMAPLLRENDAVIVNTAVPPNELKVNDIITFQAFESNVIITHRITGAIQTPEGYEFSTKGDNNTVEDNFSTPGNSVIGKYMLKIAGLASFMNVAVERPYLIALIVIGMIGAQFLFGLAENKLNPEGYESKNKNKKQKPKEEKPKE